MTIYILKVVLCSALFLSCYFLLFQKEKIYHFNRFYLLFSLFAPFVIPLIEIENGSIPINIPQVEYVNFPLQETVSTTYIHDTNIIEIQEPTINFPVSIYVLVSSILLFIFLKNIFVLIKEIRNNRKVILGRISIVLLDKKITPYSFLKYIFANREDYEKQGIETEILLHETTHIQQAHSIDILLVELMKVFLWFNPLLFFYKKAIQLNHEFLADDAVINTCGNVTNYQYLLIKKASLPNHFLFTSSFNYSITKQRLKMITKSTSKTKALLITIAFVPLFATAIFTFSTKIYAQKSTPEVKEKVVVSTKEGASDEMIAEYGETVKKYYKKYDKKVILFMETLDKDRIVKDRLVSIFLSMNDVQRRKVSLTFTKNSGPLPPNVPTEKEFENFKNPKKYGVWINDRKVKNSELDKYKASDFGQVFISRLEGGAKYKNGISRGYDFQLGLMTTDYYKKYRKETLEDKKYYLSFNWKKLESELKSE